MSFSLFAGKDDKSLVLQVDKNSFVSSEHKELSSFIDGSEFHLNESKRGFKLELVKGTLLYEDANFSAPASLEVLSGRDFKINDITLAASVRTDRVEVSKREDLKSISARSLIGLIILFEVLFITILPSKLSGKDNFKREYLMEEVSTSLDNLRNKVQGNLKGKAKNNSIKSGILKDIKNSLDALANDLRLHPHSFTIEKLEQTTETLINCERLLVRINNSPLINKNKVTLDKQKILDHTFK